MTHLIADVVTLEISGRANATPSVAALNQFVAVSWGATSPGRGTDVYAAVSRDGGRTFLRLFESTMSTCIVRCLRHRLY